VHFSLYVGVEVIVMPKFDLEKYCATVERKKATWAAVVPPIVLLLGKSPIVDKYDLSSLRLVNSGAAPLTKELVSIVRKRLSVPVRQGYGLSETSPATHQQTWESKGHPIGSIGPLLGNQVSKFVSPDGVEVPDGEVGEMWVKGPNVFKGYLNNPAKTREALSPDGYFKTGDIGYQDGEGNVFITDRSKELIKYNAFQVAPAELEGILMAHPKVADAAVVGVQDESRATEVPRAYVVIAAGVERSRETALEIEEWIKTKVANHKYLRGGVRFIDAVPKSAAGKILRSQVRELVKAEGVGAVPARSKL
jgi:acyl-CoA synthetase (AMP-forming)/AMP-acid ligase II